MAIKTLSNRVRFELGKAAIDFSSDTFKVALMESGFSFDPATHGTWADVSAAELVGGSGYTDSGDTLTVDAAWSQDDVNDKALIEWNNNTWSASGGDIGPFRAAIVYDSTHADSVVIGCIDFETDITTTDGNNFQLQDLGFEL